MAKSPADCPGREMKTPPDTMEKPAGPEAESKSATALLLGLILVTALALRIYVAANAAIVNLDGCLYIHQARAIYHGLWNALLECDYPRVRGHVSPYPFFIAGFYPLLADWILAARAVSIAFGTATVFAAYRLARLFFDARIGLLVALSFALAPLPARWSTEILRDPVAWFFLSVGLYGFALNLKARKEIWLFCAGVSLVLAASSRAETAMFLFLAAGYWLFVHRGSLKGLALLLLPAGIAGAVWLLWMPAPDGPSMDPFSASYTFGFLEAPLDRQRELFAALRQMAGQLPEGALGGFIAAAREQFWLVAVGVTVNNCLEVLWYPFFVLILFGLGDLPGRPGRDRRLFFFLILSVVQLIVLYVWTLSTWFAIKRYFAPLWLCAIPLLGSGWRLLLDRLHRRFQAGRRSLAGAVCLIAAVLTIPANMGAQEADKAVYRHIGEFLAAGKEKGREVRIGAARLSAALSWAIFYANLDVEGAPCPRPAGKPPAGPGGDGPDALPMDPELDGFDYYLFVESDRLLRRGALETLIAAGQLTPLGEWHHVDSGRIVLYAVQAPPSAKR